MLVKELKFWKKTEENGIPTYRFPESAARVMAEMCNFSWWLDRPKTGLKKFRVNRKKAKEIIEAVRSQKRFFLLEQEAYEILKAYHFPVIRSYLAKNETQAVKAAKEIGPDVIHKFDWGGVKLGLKNSSEVRQAYREILENILTKKPSAKIVGMTVEAMAPSGKEVILGMNRDPQFGPILMFGLGGIYVEALEDVSFRLAPIRELTAAMMVKKTKTHKILEGFRGGPKYDVEAIETCLKRLSQLVVDLEEIKELDINPLIVYEKGSL